MAETKSPVLKALAHPTRREVIRLLRTRDMTAGELASHFDAALSTMSGHFGVLKSAGLVQGRRSGSVITYTLNVSVLEETLMEILELFDLGADDG